MLVVVVGESRSGKTYFTNHLLFGAVPGLGGAMGTTRYFEDDVYAKKDLTEEVLEKLDNKQNVVIELRDIEDIDPTLRRKVDCYVFTSRVGGLSVQEDEMFPERLEPCSRVSLEKLKEVMDDTFREGRSSGGSHVRVIFNRRKNTLMTQIDYDL
jgi:hypothetical protein